MVRGPNILVSWVSIQHAAAPLLTVVQNRDPRICGRIDEIILCHRVNASDPSDEAALEKTREQLAALPASIRPEVTLRPWKTAARPTDHKKILEFSKAVLLDIRRKRPTATVYVHLSPGTKAMHAAWLILAHGAFIDRVHLLQTREDRFRGDDIGESLIEKVSLPRETWGHFIRTSTPAIKSDDDDGVLWDPARVMSARGKDTLKAVERWAPLPVPILLIGERGTGKTSLAHVIRARSPFQALGTKPWPVVVCGQFRANPELARSELFGHARGAFTGASSDREGVLETVQNDTLFLDEIADLDRGTQRLLIAAVEGRDFQRLGESTNRRAKFRLLAATNRPLGRLIPNPDGQGLEPNGDFALDADFFDRISTFVIHIPPLRERREDLPQLWASSLRRAARRLDLDEARGEALQQLELDRQVLAALDAHPLPGNIRDLHRAAWRAVAALIADAPRAELIRETVAGLEHPATNAFPSVASLAMPPLDLDIHLTAENRRLMLAALELSGGSKSEAARLLSLPRKTFEYRLERLTKE